MMRRLPATRVSLLVRDVRTERFGRGERLFVESEAADRLFFVRSDSGAQSASRPPPRRAPRMSA